MSITDKQGRHIVFSLFLVGMIAITIYSLIGTYKVNKYGVYVLGQLYEISSGGKGGSSKSYHYYLYGKQYSWSVKTFERDSFILLRCLPNAPKTVRPINDFEVPECVRMKDVPKNGWTNKQQIKCD